MQHNSTHNIQTFDTAAYLLTNISQNWVEATGSWRNNAQYLYSYTATHKISELIYQLWDTTAAVWVNNTNYLYTYNDTDYRTLNLVQTWDGTAWVNSTRDTSIRETLSTGSDLLLTWDVPTSTWINTRSWTYGYNAIGGLVIDSIAIWDATTSLWVNSLKLTNTYNAANDKINTLNQTWGPTSWINSYQYVYTFDAAHNNTSYTYQGWDVPSSSFISGTRSEFSSFVGGHAALVMNKQWNVTTSVFDTTNRVDYTFNIYAQPLTYYVSQYLGGGIFQSNTSSTGYRYYYELFDTTTTTTAVNNVSNSTTATVYPIPAQNTLHIAITWNEPQAFTTQITDMLGNVVRQYNMPCSKTYTGELPLTNLPTGNYLLNMTGPLARSTNRIVIIK